MYRKVVVAHLPTKLDPKYDWEYHCEQTEYDQALHRI